MRIERLQVEEGFLDQLDVPFVPGLNVLIGARGTGKTSCIELIRFCLGAPAFTDDAGHRGEQQALSVLGGGRVTVTFSVDGSRYTLSRTATDPAPALSGGVTVLAQSEIEAIGTHTAGRMHLIDRYRDDRADEVGAAREVMSRLRSATARLTAVLAEVQHLTAQTQSMSTVPEQLSAATAEQADLLAKVEATEDERARLGGLQEQSTRLSAEAVVLERTRSATTEFANRLAALRSTDDLLEAWVAGQQEPEEYSNARAQIEQSAARIAEAQAAAMTAIENLQVLIERNQHERAQVEDDSRHLRARLNSLQEGAGNITRRVDGLREQLGQLESVQELLQSRTASVAELAAERSSIFNEVDRLRDARFEGRRAVGERLNAELGPRINVSLRRSGEKSAYVSAIIAGLRGSGLHYNDLAPQLADAMTPLELVDCVDASDIEHLATLAEIPTNRAAAVAQQLQSADLADIIAAPIEDSVEFFLLDGSEYKPTSHLSIGQRCTVVLPLLLSRHGDSLIVDQPEDHIDNAFITSTLVSTLRSRLSTDQFIFSSHNANIPVLGEADNVIHLESDGRRGFARSHGGLDDPATIDAISHVMEGGPEAFAARAEFYATGRTSSPSSL